MTKNLILGPILAKFGPKKYFLQVLPLIFYVRGKIHCCKMLHIVASYHCMQFQGTLTNQTSENGKKPSFDPDFGPFGPNLGHKFFFRAFQL